MMKLKHVKRWTAIWLFGVAVLPISCGRSVGSAPETDYPTLTVTTGNEMLQSSSSATIRGRQDIEIYPQISGKITRLRVS